jgi:hypothetical protein
MKLAVVCLLSLTFAGVAESQNALPPATPGQEIQVPSYLLHKNSLTQAASLPTAPILYPLRCGSRGEIFLRMFHSGDTIGSPIVELNSDGKSVVRTYDFRKIQDSEVPHADKFGAVDFQVTGSHLYVVGSAQMGGKDLHAQVLEFSTTDGSYDGAIPLEMNFMPYRIAFYESGGFVTTGLLTRFDPQTHKARTEPATLRYGADGRLVDYVHLFGETTFAGDVPRQQEIALMGGISLAGYGSTVYMLGAKTGTALNLYEIQEGSPEVVRRKLWVPGENWDPLEFLVSGESILVDFVYNLQSSGKTKEFVNYSLPSGQPVSIEREADDVYGAFACYDWQGQYTYISSENKHLAVLKADAR